MNAFWQGDFLWTGFRVGATILAQILHTKTDNSPISCAEIASPDAAPILLVTHEYAPFRGGVATYVRELARAAGRRHERVEVWTADYRGRFKEAYAANEGEEAGIPVIRLPSDGRLTPAGLGRLAWGLWRRRNRWDQAPVLLMSVGAQMVFFLLALVPGLMEARRMVPFFHGSEILRFARSRFWRPLARRFYARAGGFGVTSLHVESLLRDSGLLPAGAAITLAPCALPTAFVARAQGEPTAARKEETDGKWRVLTVARLHPRKGQLDVARALGRLPADLRARLVYQVVGVGEEDYRRAVAAACREAGVPVEFLGAVDDRTLAGVYASATLYVQASRTLARSVEGFGITFLEASFHGCPVAAYRSGGVGEAVLDGETGLLVAEGDEAALADAIRRLLEDRALRERLGQRGREFALSFRWENAAAALCAVARKACAEAQD